MTGTDCEDRGGSCAEGQLIGMTEWRLPEPEPTPVSEIPCPRH